MGLAFDYGNIVGIAPGSREWIMNERGAGLETARRSCNRSGLAWLPQTSYEAG